MAANKANYLFNWEIHRNRRVGITGPSDVCEKRGGIRRAVNGMARRNSGFSAR